MISLDIVFTSFTISWSPLDTATTYAVSYFTSNTSCYTASNTISGIRETMYTLTGLEEGTDYSITVTGALSGGRTENRSINGTTLTASKSILACCTQVLRIRKIILTVWLCSNTYNVNRLTPFELFGTIIDQRLSLPPTQLHLPLRLQLEVHLRAILASECGGGQ